MTSPSSGFMTMRENVSQEGDSWISGYVSVPVKNMVILSFKEISSKLTKVSLFCHSKYFGPSVGYFQQRDIRIWNREEDIKSDFAHACNATLFSLRVWRKPCIMTRCFTLFFSFFPELRTPLKLPNGLWNCSVGHYPRFRHHVDCNLQTECEDGRDETGHCPYSSPGCQGMVALCGRCYMFFNDLSGISNDVIDVRKMTEHCNTLKGAVSAPMCVYDWYSVVIRVTAMHPKRLDNHFVGVFVNDRKLPAMYIHERFHDRLVLHHTFLALFGYHLGKILCFRTQYPSDFHGSENCVIPVDKARPQSVVCEIQPNKAKDQLPYRKPIMLNRTRVAGPWRQECKKIQPDGHITYTFLTCGSHPFMWYGQQHTSCHFSKHSVRNIGIHSSHDRISVSTFTCSDDITTLSYTLVCNFICDCRDNSDELICEHPTCAIDDFTCSNGQCLSFDKVCDQTPQCWDDSDELSCKVYKLHVVWYRRFSGPALVQFDSTRKFTSFKIHPNDSCPDSHYRCPGDFSDCLPVFTRCNGMHDCMDRQDEDGCGHMMCPGFFRCRASTTCLHADQLCDGWPHCPMHDDEIACDTSCPVGCLCQGHAFFCPQPFSMARLFNVRSLDATGSGMTLSDMRYRPYLIHLILAQCSLSLLPNIKMSNLKFLDLSENKLREVNMTFFLGLRSLQALSLSHNPLTSLYTDLFSVSRQSLLTQVDLSFTTLTELDTQVFSPFPHVQKLNLTFTTVHTISPSGFQLIPQLTELLMDGSPVTNFPTDVFKGLFHLQAVTTQNYKLCCRQILPSRIHRISCYAPKDEISSCEDLLQSWLYRGFLWLITCLSLTGNVFCFCARVFVRSMTSSSGYSVFVLNLTLADLLMGVYIAIIGVADGQFRGRYVGHDDWWKSSVACKVAGALSLLSSEVSALVIWLITLDRFVVLRFPFSTLRFERTSAGVACLLTWLTGWTLAVLPLLPMTSHWKFYSQTGICIPLPVTRQAFKGRVYSFSVLIVFNFVLFLLISAGQASIYWSVQKNALKTSTTNMSRDMAIAQRLITVAVTDFMCWFPIGLCGILAAAGTPIPGQVNVALAIFILPLNSAINPFMYTFNTLAEKWRRSDEAKLLQWLKSHCDTLVLV